MKSSLKKFGEVNVIALILIVLIFPIVFAYAKIVLLLGFLLVSTLYLAISGGQTYIFNKQVLICLISIFGLNLFFVLWGAINGAESEALIESLNIYVLYPSFYIFLIVVLPHILSVKTLTTVLLVVSIIVSYIVIAHACRKKGVILPGYEVLYLVYPELQWSIKTFEFSGKTGYLPRVMERLIFLAPFSVVLVAVRKSIGFGRFIVWTNLMLIIMAVLVSERRAMVLGLFLTVVAVVVGFRLINVRLKRGVTLGLIATAVFLTVGASYWSSATEVNGDDLDRTKIYRSYTERSLTTRGEQFEVLMEAAADSPILGVGFGNSIHGYARDREHPWRFELTYVALLFQTGIIGIILYTMVFILLLVIAINSFKKSGEVVLPYIFGLVIGLIAVSTNPYLAYGTGQWILFLPLAVFNSLLLAKDRIVALDYKLSNKNMI